MPDSNTPRAKYRSPDRRQMRALCRGRWLPTPKLPPHRVMATVDEWIPIRERRKLSAHYRAERLKRVRGS